MATRAIYLLGGDLDNAARAVIATKKPETEQRVRKISRADLADLHHTAKTLAESHTTANRQRWQARELQLRQVMTWFDGGYKGMRTHTLSEIGKF